MRRAPSALFTCVIVGVVVLVIALAGATAAGLIRRRRDGRFRDAPAGGDIRPRLTEADLGRPLGARATLVQFSSAFCAPCRAARSLLADVAARGEGVVHVEIDVADRLDLVRRLEVSRTPTVFVLGPDGEIARRASGVPPRAEVEAAMAAAAGDPGPATSENLFN